MICTKENQLNNTEALFSAENGAFFVENVGESSSKAARYAILKWHNIICCLIEGEER